MQILLILGTHYSRSPELSFLTMGALALPTYPPVAGSGRVSSASVGGPGPHTWVVLNYTLDIVGPAGRPWLQGPLACGQGKLQPPGLVRVLRSGEEGDQAIRARAAHHHRHQLQCLEGDRDFCKKSRFLGRSTKETGVAWAKPPQGLGPCPPTYPASSGSRPVLLKDRHGLCPLCS